MRGDSRSRSGLSVPFRLVVKVWLAALIAALVLVVRRGRRVDRGQAGPLHPDGRRRLDRRDAVRPGRDAASRRLAGDRLPARARRQPAADERARRGIRIHGRELRDPDVRRPRDMASPAGSSGSTARARSPTRAPIHDWLAARPDVSDTRIGAWGISYGGGAVFNSLVAGVPWAAVATVETWTDLYSALMPQGLVKSGLVAGLAGSIPAATARSVARRRPGGGLRRGMQAPCETGPPHARASVQARHPSRRPSSWRRGGVTSCSESTRARAHSGSSQQPEAAVRRPARPRPSVVPRRRHRQYSWRRRAPGSTATSHDTLLTRPASTFAIAPEDVGSGASSAANRPSPDSTNDSSRSRASRPSRAAERPFGRPRHSEGDIEVFGTPTVKASIASARRLVEARRRAHRSHAKR